MTEPTPGDEQKAAVAAMRGATKAMTRTLERVDTLERALRLAQSRLKRLQACVGGEAYMLLHGNQPQRLVDYITEAHLEIEKALV